MSDGMDSQVAASTPLEMMQSLVEEERKYQGIVCHMFSPFIDFIATNPLTYSFFLSLSLPLSPPPSL